MKALMICSIFLTAVASSLNGQGCVAIRQMGSCQGGRLSSNILTKGNWQANVNYRYFKSFRHFKGTEEQADRVANNTEVINHAHAWDFNLSYGLTNRLYAAVTLPYVINVRSSLYEHGRTERHTTFSRGLADVRVGAGYWLRNPDKSPESNIALGLGVKLPTGNYNASDIFYNVGPNGDPQVRPVDQSIQPGDGGFGISADVQFYQKISGKLFLFGNAFYLANPKETNGTRTFRETLNAILQNEAITSVPDQFGARAGVIYGLSESFSAAMAARYEGVPVEDLIGGSLGFRRPGTVLSVEPGISYMKNNIGINLNVPIALRRKRPQSVTDKLTEQATGQPRNGDAAFADYLINFGITYRFKKGMEHH